MQTFGSNPEKLVNQLGHDLLKQMMQDPKYVKEHRKIQKQAKLIDRHYDELAGQALPIDSNLAQVGGMLRSWTIATKMGSAFITAFLFNALNLPYSPFKASITSSADASVILVKYFKIA